VQACRYFVKDFGTSESPKSTHQRDNLLLPRPSRSPALRHSIEHSLQATAPDPEMTRRPGRRRSVDPLWRFARRGSSIALRATGDYRPSRALSMAGSVGFLPVLACWFGLVGWCFFFCKSLSDLGQALLAATAC
jgi:hypothetical protein